MAVLQCITDLVSSEVNVPELSAAVNVAHSINAVVVENERLKLATGREMLYGNWGRGLESVKYSVQRSKDLIDTCI